MIRLSRIVVLLIGMIVLSTVIGCTTFGTSFAKKFPKATASDPVAEILCLWTPGEGNDPEGVPCKGFMGQVLFLSQSASKPVEVSGDVRIYLFDDQGTPEEQAKPLRVFNFDSGSWGIHLTDSSFGAAYRVFVPYVRRGASNANCSLRVRFKPKQGPVVFSEFTNMPLTGYKKSLRGDEAKPINQEEVDKLAADAMSTELRRTTTISLGTNPKVTESSKVTESVPQPKPETNAGQIQLATYEPENETALPSADADRIRRLESMVQQLLEQRTANSANSVSIASPRKTENQLPAESPNADVSVDTERIRLNPRGKTPVRDAEPNWRTAPRRLSHPLEEDEPGESQANTTAGDNSATGAAAAPSAADVEPSPRFNLRDGNPLRNVSPR